ncbi:MULTISPECIES: hypothetical protein [Streptomyces]|uniref:hypothetical protein n=1 Tax=Streptomyces TaxID=1883 RepID=UPI00114D0369|nr:MULTISPECIES: hypothetical protein [unclassified Streptomyces]MYT18517.1 hypothetical protein [Streptomyces sp. SID4951]
MNGSILMRAQVERLESMAHLLASLEWLAPSSSPINCANPSKTWPNSSRLAAERPHEDTPE